jgi:hypothetical protein
MEKPAALAVGAATGRGDSERPKVASAGCCCSEAGDQEAAVRARVRAPEEVGIATREDDTRDLKKGKWKGRRGANRTKRDMV